MKGLTFEERYGPEKAAAIKAKMSAAKKGKTWEAIFGKEVAAKLRTKQNPEYRAKLSKALKGRTHEEIYGVEGAEKRKARQKEVLTGRPRSQETKDKISEANSGRKLTDEHKQKLREAKLGENHWRWRGEDFEREYPPEWRDIRLLALARDGYSCVQCGITANEWKSAHDRGLHVDHINAMKSDMRLDNLQTLCPPCHVDKTFDI